MDKFKKINILGCAGSGKTYISVKLSEILKVKATELDELFWDKTDNYYIRKSIPENRDKELSKLIEKESWILEGVYFDWLLESFQKADLIIFLRPNFTSCTLRIIVRFLKEKIGIIQPSKKETYAGLIQILKRNRRYHKVHIPEIIELLSAYKTKVKFFNKGDEAINFILSSTGVSLNNSSSFYKIKSKKVTGKLASIKIPIKNYFR